MPKADQVRAVCKRGCGVPLLFGQPSVWLTGQLLGLAHADCAASETPAKAGS